MQSPPLHHPVPQHRVNLDAAGFPYTQPDAPPSQAEYPQYAQQFSGQSVSGPQIPGQPIAGRAILGQSAPGHAIPGQAIPGQQFQGQPMNYQPGVTTNYAADPVIQPQAGGFPPHFNPLDFVGGAQLSQNALNYGQSYISQRIDRYGVSASYLRYYFQVTNQYVRQKLILILFPWRHKPWSRQLQPAQVSGGADKYAFPRDDINAPDMYIPVLAFITHLVVIALGQGLEGKFHPEQFGARASKALALVIGELVLLKIFTYLLAASSSSLLDLFAYSGYKFVAITLTTLIGLITTNRIIWWGAFAYTGVSTAFFMLRSLKYILLPEYSATNAASAATNISGSKRQQRIQFLFFYGVVCQIIQIWLLL